MHAALKLALLGTVLSVSACLGQYELPEVPVAMPLALCQPEQSGFELQLKPVAPRILSTGKSLWKTHLGYVYPYGKTTVQYEVELKNTGADVLKLGDRVQLSLGDSELSNHRSLEEITRLWPAKGVHSESDLLARSQVMRELHQHLWQGRTLRPGETYDARWVFAPFSQRPDGLKVAGLPALALCQKSAK